MYGQRDLGSGTSPATFDGGAAPDGEVRVERRADEADSEAPFEAAPPTDVDPVWETGSGSGAPAEVDPDVLDAIEEQLADVERALARLDAGTYGTCEHCGGGIGDTELALEPGARFCRDHLPPTLQ